MREKLSLPTNTISPKSEDNLVLPKPQNIRKRNLNKSLEVSFARKSIVDHMYECMLMSPILLLTSTYIDLLLPIKLV
jgi:hypothetical protein